MDPAVFFGRPTRVTRQTVTPKESEKENVRSEVTSKNQKISTPSVGKETRLLRSAKTNPPENKKSGRIVKNKSEASCDEHLPPKKKVRKPTLQTREVHFEENEKSDNKKSGPVYQCVLKSDVTSDPFNEYEFQIDENDVPSKKKKQRKTNTSKNKKNGGVVLWDPSKRPIRLKPSKPKSIKSKSVQLKEVKESVNAPARDQGKLKRGNVAPKEQVPQLLKSTNMPVDKLKAIPANVSACPVSNVACKEQLPQLQKSTNMPVDKLKALPANVSACPVSKNLNPSTSATTSSPSQNSEAQAVSSVNKATSVASKQKPGSSSVPIPSKAAATNQENASGMAPPRSSFTSSIGMSSPCFDNSDHFASTPVASSKTHDSNSSLASVPETSAVRCQQPQISTCSSARSIPVLTLSIRESPSFMEQEPDAVRPSGNKSSNANCGKEVASIESTPVTRSKSTISKKAMVPVSGAHTIIPPSSPCAVTCSPTPVSGTPLKSSWGQSNESPSDNLSGLFDDMPRDSVIPTRMFSTYRGTIFVPNKETNIIKRVAPDVSPGKAPSVSRPTTVKFSVPQSSSSSLNDCFGFDEEDSAFVPQSLKRREPGPVAHAPMKKPQSRPRLPIQKVQAILMGQLNITSPISSTPRTVQTKLTDFVCSTPTRAVETTKAALLTPTPVPLFGEEQLDAELPSPYVQPSRRSYDRFHPGKRIACGNEVLSDEDDGESTKNEGVSSSIPAAQTKKKNRSYKKKKKPADIQLDNWAKEIASHFEEVEEVSLEFE